MSETRRLHKKEHKKKKGDLTEALSDIVTEQSLEKNYKILGKVMYIFQDHNHKSFITG